MFFYPKDYFNKISEISLTYLKQNQLKGLILDVDNTLIDYDKNITEETIDWVEHLKQNGIKMCILSNSNQKEKVKDVAQKLGIEYSYFAMKPFKRGFRKAQKILQLNHDEIAVIGDQIFTDVMGANRMKMYAILVEPIHKKDIFITLLKRPLENYIKQKFLKQNTQQNKQPTKEDKNVL